MPITWDELQSDYAEKNTPLKQSLDVAVDRDPDKMATDRRLAEEAGIPVSLVDGNRPVVERQARAKRIDPDYIAEQSPELSKWLVNPDNAAISYDDLDTLVSFDTELRRKWTDVDSRVLKGLGDSMMIGWGKTVDQAALAILSEKAHSETHSENLIKNLRAQGKDDLADRMRERVDATAAARDERMRRHLDNIRIASEEQAVMTPPDLTILEEGIRGGVQMVSDLVPGIATSIATRGKVNPTLQLLTAKTGLESYGEGRVEGLDHATALAYGGIDAALEWSTERIPVKRLEKIFGELGDGGIKSSIKRWLVAEAGSEQIATATQSLNAYMFGLDEELAAATSSAEVLEIQGRRQAVTFLSTLIGGGSLSAGIKGVDYFAGRERRAFNESLRRASKHAGSEQEQDRLNNMIYLAQASKTNERAADVFRDFVDNAGKDEKIYMDAAAVELLDDPPEYLVAQLDGSEGTVVMDLGQFLTDFANDEQKLELVRRHIKTEESLMTEEELETEADSEYIKNILERANAAKESRDEAQQIYQQVVESIVSTGRQAEQTARQSAALIPAVVATQYEELKRLGIANQDGSEITIKQLFEDMGMRVAGPAGLDPNADYMAAAGYEVLPAGAVGFTEKRIQDLFPELAYAGDPAKTKGAIAFINPNDFIPVTSIDAERLRAEVEPLDAERLSRETQTPYLKVARDDDGGWRIVGHEGRHRMGALAAAGYTRVPVMLRHDQGGVDQSEFDDLAALRRQVFAYNIEYNVKYLRKQGRAEEAQDLEAKGQALRSADPRLDVDAVIPVSYANRDKIKQALRSGDLLFQGSGVLKQQNFGDITLKETTRDPLTGAAIDLEVPAQQLWDEQQARLQVLEQLEKCLAA